ncbi:Putative glucose-6-phosphate 1-epimerase [Pirellula sp. SH-Sr6A]|uniref:D-hexose-6-phosphate mutarotase n=1 Tax=Pirellula sp. SH-Sr6A TaxID=1632865 RepID=UPI00078DF88A|nr:D-hexose-6-phosphate mutarotase [Pirellula sp. SH-Sr6A]AMV32519.1 Putative glucose-6-phosphate 1-epimerase [Pirellula sp. SH-Sr6A]
MDAHQLQQTFGIDSALCFENHSSGLVQGVVQTKFCEGRFFLHGAHVSHWHPSHTAWPVLFMSEQSSFAEGKPIRGGIPLCFPWFSAHPTDPSQPAHGLVRQARWKFVESRFENESVRVVMERIADEFLLRCKVEFGTELALELKMTNRSSQTRDCEVALHTYFDVAAIEKVSVEGLEKVPYFDQLSRKVCSAEHKPVRFDRETDRIYQGPVGSILLRDAERNRTISIDSANANSTIVWNPWVEKSKRMPDFGDEEYHRMCCIETASVRDHRMTLAPSETHIIGVRYSVGP